MASCQWYKVFFADVKVAISNGNYVQVAHTDSTRGCEDTPADKGSGVHLANYEEMLRRNR